MKVFTNDKVYVQKQDLAFFLRGVGNLAFPSSIFDKIFGEGIYQPFFVDESNKYDFVEFDKLDEIAFFKKCDWIVDYNMFDGMTKKEIENEANKVLAECDIYTSKHNNLPDDERKNNYKVALLELEHFNHKIRSIMQIKEYKYGALEFQMPYNEEIVKEETKENRFQKILRKFRKK